MNSHALSHSLGAEAEEKESRQGWQVWRFAIRGGGPHSAFHPQPDIGNSIRRILDGFRYTLAKGSFSAATRYRRCVNGELCRFAGVKRMKRGVVLSIGYKTCSPSSACFGNALRRTLYGFRYVLAKMSLPAATRHRRPVDREVHLVSIELILGLICGRRGSGTADVFYFEHWNAFYHCTTVLYCFVLHCTVLNCTARYCTVLYCTVLSCPVLSCLFRFGPVLSCSILSCLVLSCFVLSCPVLSCPLLSCSVQ